MPWWRRPRRPLEEEPCRRTSPPAGPRGRSAPPRRFRADHVGSLLRPRHLLQAREDHAAGWIDAAALREVEDRAILEAIGLQREAGLRSATDGEFRRGSWHMDFIYRLEGVSRAWDNLTVHFHNVAGDIDFTPAALPVDGRIGLSKTIFGDDFAFLRDHAAAGSRRS